MLDHRFCPPPATMWIAYLAMATALVPLVCMGIGYLLVREKKESERTGAPRG
jgi:hypothetical protein